MLKYTGIQNPYAIGDYGVEKNAKILQRYRYIHEQLMRVMAGKLPALEDWDLKITVCKHLYENAEAAELLRKRIPTLRTSTQLLVKEPDPTLTLLMEELLHSQHDLEFVVGVYEVIKPALLQMYIQHMEKTQQIVDQPTIRMLKTIVHDLREQLEWGNEMLQSLREAKIHPNDASEFKEKLLSYLQAAGGVDGLMEKSPVIPSRWRSHEPYVVPLKSARDCRKMGPTTLKRTGVANPPIDPLAYRLVEMMRVRQEEMTGAELLAGVLFSQNHMPWSFYYDLARHIWDEARHAMFGQAALEAEGYDWMSRPQYTLDYDLNAHKIPGSQYAWLSIAIEEGSMISNGKKKEYEFCRNEVKHPLMTMFQDYDWADEVLHANFGRRWTPEIFGEELPFVREIAQKEMDQVLEALAQSDKNNDYS